MGDAGALSECDEYVVRSRPIWYIELDRRRVQRIGPRCKEEHTQLHASPAKKNTPRRVSVPGREDRAIPLCLREFRILFFVVFELHSSNHRAQLLRWLEDRYRTS